ncbi:MAG: energy-coupling factor ABC transporter ATP-binding protein [Paracoccaceae bacterium]
MSDLFPLHVTGAITRRRSTPLVGPVDLTLEGHGICVVLGPNGAGKTSLLRMLHGIARLHAGQIRWACAAQTAQNQQAFVFQNPVMLRRSVLDNLTYPLTIKGMPVSAARMQAQAWAKQAGLGGLLEQQAPSLSGGEQQKLALCRALISAPKLIFMDEPSASLDGRATRDIEQILIDTRAKGTQILMSTHDMGQARRLADYVIFMRGGLVHETGPALTFFNTPQTPEARAFLNGDIVE